MTRHLRERDASRAAGDRLAQAGLDHHTDADLAAALIAYGNDDGQCWALPPGDTATTEPEPSECRRSPPVFFSDPCSAPAVQLLGWGPGRGVAPFVEVAEVAAEAAAASVGDPTRGAEVPRLPLHARSGACAASVILGRSCNPVQGPRNFLPVREKPSLWTLDPP